MGDGGIYIDSSGKDSEICSSSPSHNTHEKSFFGTPGNFNDDKKKLFYNDDVKTATITVNYFVFKL